MLCLLCPSCQKCIQCPVSCIPLAKDLFNVPYHVPPHARGSFNALCHISFMPLMPKVFSVSYFMYPLMSKMSSMASAMHPSCKMFLHCPVSYIPHSPHVNGVLNALSHVPPCKKCLQCPVSCIPHDPHAKGVLNGLCHVPPHAHHTKVIFNVICYVPHHAKDIFNVLCHVPPHAKGVLCALWQHSHFSARVPSFRKHALHQFVRNTVARNTAKVHNFPNHGAVLLSVLFYIQVPQYVHNFHIPGSRYS